MTLSGMSTPLLGMVDTAVMGHLDAAYYLGAVAVGSLVFSFLFWGFGFLRMGVTGLTAQAVGAENSSEIVGTLSRGLVLAVVFGLLLILFQSLIISASLFLIETSENVESNLAVYLDVRILSAPAALLNYVLLGWFLGIQHARYTLYLLLLVNITNIILDVLFVVVWDWRVEGVAWASVCAEYLGLLLGLYLMGRYLKHQVIPWSWRADMAINRFAGLFRVSVNIFIRTLCLIGSFAFFTLQGAKYGEVTLAANAILMNFQTFMAHGLDGFAHAAEALVGKYFGKRDYRKMTQAIVVCAFWSVLIALFFVLFYGLFGDELIKLLTDITEVQQTALMYLPWAIAAPFISVWGYFFDGVYIGMSWSAAMRNTMLISTFIFLCAWFFTQNWGNHGLWVALMLFMLARGVTMGLVFQLKSSRQFA